jgi:hypothetical protein
MPQQMLYGISIEGRGGFINAAGEIAIPPQFLSVSQFSEGVCAVTVPDSTEEGKVFDRTHSGFIDCRGDFVIGPGAPSGVGNPSDINGYSYGDFNEARAKLWVGDASGLGGFIDRTGEIAIPIKYPHVGKFSCGLAKVALPRADGSPFGPKTEGFIDREGRMVLQLPTGASADAFSEDLCVLTTQNKNRSWQASVINAAGKYIVPPGTYTAISNFVDGIARAVKKGEVGCINTLGEAVIPTEFDQLWEFEQNPFATAKKAGQWSIIDRKGRVVRRLELEDSFEVGRLRSGFATARLGNKVGYVNEAGQLAVPLRFDRGEEFVEELARVEWDCFTGYINRRGDVIWQTNCWDEPVRNAVCQPLSDFLPPGTLEAQPLEYNWQGVQNAIVFAANDLFEVLPQWYESAFQRDYQLSTSNEESGRVSISFPGDALRGSVQLVDVQDGDVASFFSFYASPNSKRMLEQHRPTVLGILILER